MTPIDALMRMLGLHRRMKKELEDRLDDLVRQGRIIRLRGGAWGLVEQLRLVTGTLSIQRSGMGFVLPEEKGRDDIYVHPYQMGDAWHGDKVVVALLPGRHGKNPEGRIVRVVERGRKEIPARVVRRMGRHSLLCRAADPRMAVSFVVDMSAVEEKAEKGHGKEKKEEKGGHGGGKEGEADPALGKISEGPDGVTFYTLPNMVANIQSPDGRPTYLKLTLTLEMKDAEVAAHLQEETPRMQDMFQSFLRELRPEDLAGSAGSYQIRAEILRRVNLLAAPGKVDAVLIEEMLVQ